MEWGAKKILNAKKDDYGGGVGGGRGDPSCDYTMTPSMNTAPFNASPLFSLMLVIERTVALLSLMLFTCRR